MSARRAGLHVVLPLGVGVATYLLGRPSAVRLFDPLDALGLGPSLDRLRSVTIPIARHLPSVVLGSAPDAAWAWAFGAALSLVWEKEAGASARAWLLLGASAAVAVELGQGLGLVPGAFDGWDLLAIATGYGLGALAVRVGRMFPAAHRLA